MHSNDSVRHENSLRCAAEQRNVVLFDVYILGVKREDDGDFHLLVGSKPESDKKQKIITAEVSGLPDPSSPAYAALAAVRKIYETQFGNKTTEGLVFFSDAKHPAVHLQHISGSLFFDNHHYSSHSSIKNLKADSCWEIHPVTGLVFG